MTGWENTRLEIDLGKNYCHDICQKSEGVSRLFKVEPIQKYFIEI